MTAFQLHGGFMGVYVVILLLYNIYVLHIRFTYQVLHDKIKNSRDCEAGFLVRLPGFWSQHYYLTGCETLGKSLNLFGLST